MARFPQLARQPLLRSPGSVNPENRVWAKAIDALLVALFALAISFFSPLASVAFVIVAWTALDSLGRGQSPGKWLLGLHTIELRRGQKPDWKRAWLRNLPFLQIQLGFAFGGIWIWLLLVPGLVWIGLETYFIFRLESGLRVGDLLSGTRVFDYKDEHTKFIEQFLKDQEDP